MRTALRKLGNSAGVIIPKPILAQLGVTAGDELELSFEEDHIVLSATNRRPRAGWADAAREIAAAGDDTLAWPEFGNADDADLKW